MNCDTIISFLLEYDYNFKKFWINFEDKDKFEFIRICNLFDDRINKEPDDLMSIQEEIHLNLRTQCSIIQEREITYTMMPKNWDFILEDKKRLEKCYKTNLRNLKFIIESNNFTEHLKIYGGIKPSDSIKSKIFMVKESDNIARKTLIDIWDIVRYRICCNNLNHLLEISFHIWDYYFDKIIKCKNYYFTPRGDSAIDTYRAIHFQILDNNNSMFELQIMTVYREAVSLIDHSIKFKKSLQASDQMKDHINKYSIISNLLEFDNFKRIF